MFSFTSRQAIIGSQVVSQSETHGDDKKTAFRIPVTHVMLEARELNAMLEDPFTHHFMFTTKAGDAMPVGRFPQLQPFAFKYKFENGNVKIKYGIDGAIEFTACKITKVKLQPRDGGMCEIQFLVHTIPVLDVHAAHFLGQVGKEIEIEVHAELSGEDAQQDLPLNQHGEGEEPEQAA